MHQNTIIGLGLAATGRPQYINIRSIQNAASPFKYHNFYQKGLNFITDAYQMGVRHFDTAPGYGIAEQLLLDWLSSKNDIPDLAISTKWGYTYTANFDPTAQQHEIKEHSLKKLEEQWTISKQLCPNLKIYQIHSATFETGVLENEAVLNRLFEIKQKYNLEIGLTTTGINQADVLKKAQNIKIQGQYLFTTFQVTFNIFDQSTFSICKNLISSNKKIIIKEALANGRVFPNQNYPYYRDTYQTLTALSKKYKVGIDAIALRFCIQAFSPYMVLSGASNIQHLRENLHALSFTLSQEDFIRLSKYRISPVDYWSERKQLSWN